MQDKFVYPENMLNKNQIMDLIFKDELSYKHQFHNEDKNPGGDLAGYAEMQFGPFIFNEGFARFTNEEVQDWYYREYLPDRETDIAEGYDRGQQKENEE